MPGRQRLFLRFGSWEESERGIAVFPTRYDADEQSYVYAPAGPEEAHDASTDNYKYWRKPTCLVKGEEIGHGPNGAVLIRNVHIVGYILAAYVEPVYAWPHLIRVPKRMWETVHTHRGRYPHVGIYIYNDRPLGEKLGGLFAKE